jgi:hypothetical protein
MSDRVRNVSNQCYRDATTYSFYRVAVCVGSWGCKSTAVSLGEQLPAFCIFGVMQSKRNCLPLETQGSAILRDIAKYSSDTASHPSRL